MGQIAKAYLGLFFLIIATILGIGTTSMGIDTSAAQNYHADVIAEIENSNFNPGVIAACESQASAAGYELNVNSVNTDTDNNVILAEVTLKYNYTMDLLGITKPVQIRGIAR